MLGLTQPTCAARRVRVRPRVRSMPAHQTSPCCCAAALPSSCDNTMAAQPAARVRAGTAQGGGLKNDSDALSSLERDQRTAVRFGCRLRPWLSLDAGSNPQVSLPGKVRTEATGPKKATPMALLQGLSRGHSFELATASAVITRACNSHPTACQSLRPRAAAAHHTQLALLCQTEAKSVVRQSELWPWS